MRVGYHRKRRSVHASLANYVFGQTLVETDSKYERIRKRVFDTHHIQHGRHLRFASLAPRTFCNVEHQVPTFLSSETLHQRERATDPCDGMALTFQRTRYRVNGLDPVELGDLFVGVAAPKIIIL